MPKENFYWSGQVEGDGREPDLTVTWHEDAHPIGVRLNGHIMDRAGLNRLIKALRRARDYTYGADA